VVKKKLSVVVRSLR